MVAKCKSGGGEGMFTQQELTELLNDIGEKVSSQTLRTREKQGLVCSSYRGGSGRAGRSVFYPPEALWENYASGRMLKSPRMKLTAKEVKTVRDIALAILEHVDELKKQVALPTNEQLDFKLSECWLAYYLHAKYGFKRKFCIIVEFQSEEGSYKNYENIYKLVACTKLNGVIEKPKAILIINICETFDGLYQNEKWIPFTDSHIDKYNTVWIELDNLYINNLEEEFEIVEEKTTEYCDEEIPF